ncbi:hypothetical protein ILUMI_23764 [Ignelater luminosus]|uniref:Uncharacterized protein n=1 Tax=Ignelater luminosus TaxID=2038154 RepID=A0A8K0CAB5_IGNLU|nr:hypothetical protein ILUMI_23764 [Ignelater luminosus]
MLSSLRTKNINCEEEAKFTQDRIQLAEKNLAEFCHTFAQYSRKVARVRDKGDSIAQAIVNFAESEEINKSLSLGLANFASTFATISDYGDARVQHIDNKVVREFSQYENVCKQAKEEVKQIFNARDRELSRKKQLDRIREKNPRNRQQIIQAETELVKATAEVSRTINNLEEKITAFERQKLHDIKAILLNFLAVEIGYHAKALEQLTKAYQDINSIDERADLKEFKKSLRIPDTTAAQTRSKPIRSPFRTSHSLGSINTLFSTTHRTRSSPGIPTSTQGKSKSSTSKSVETLNSIKDELSDSTESNSEQSDHENSSVNTEHTEEKPSPFIARKYLK